MRGGLVSIGSNITVGWSSRIGDKHSGVSGSEVVVCSSVAGGDNSGSAGRSSGKRIRTAAVEGQGATSRAVEWSQRDLSLKLRRLQRRQRDSPLEQLLLSQTE